MFKWWGRGSRVENKQTAILRLLREIKMTQAELKAQLDTVTAQLAKIGGETTTLLTRIQELLDIIATSPVSAELEAAANALKAQAQVVDDLVPDPVP